MWNTPSKMTPQFGVTKFWGACGKMSVGTTVEKRRKMAKKDLPE